MVYKDKIAELRVWQKFWRDFKGDSYGKEYKERSLKLVELVEFVIAKESNPSILELGCNIGRNLEYLRRAGYTNLTGIDISYDVISRIKYMYPKLWEICGCYINSIEEFFTVHEGIKLDVIFTMAVLMHMHPKSEWVFAKMAERCNYLVTIEKEDRTGIALSRTTVRNYKEVFEGLGMKQIHEESMGDKMGKLKPWHKPYMARVFKNG